jgi:hypothetical protein
MENYATYNGNSLTTFTDNLPIIEDVTDTLTHNFGK